MRTSRAGTGSNKCTAPSLDGRRRGDLTPDGVDDNDGMLLGILLMLKVFEAAFEAYTQDRVHEFSMEQKEYYTRYLEFFGRLLELRPASLTSFRQPITPTTDRAVQCWLHNVLNMVDTRVKWETFVQFPHLWI